MTKREKVMKGIREEREAIGAALKDARDALRYAKRQAQQAQASLDLGKRSKPSH